MTDLDCQFFVFMYFHSGSQSLCHALLSGVEELRLLAIHSKENKGGDENEEEEVQKEERKKKRTRRRGGGYGWNEEVEGDGIVDESYLFMTAICFSATSSTAARERIL